MVKILRMIECLSRAEVVLIQGKKNVFIAIILSIDKRIVLYSNTAKIMAR